MNVKILFSLLLNDIIPYNIFDWSLLVWLENLAIVNIWRNKNINSQSYLFLIDDYVSWIIFDDINNA